jgi:hypothetical protein
VLKKSDGSIFSRRSTPMNADKTILLIRVYLCLSAATNHLAFFSNLFPGGWTRWKAGPQAE